MKKIYLLILSFFPFLLIMQPEACAMHQFDEILSDKIAEYGVFDGSTGIIYAGEKQFEDCTSLFIVRAEENSIKCEVYGDNDGTQLTDILNFSLKNDSTYKIFTVKLENTDYMVFSSSSPSVYKDFFSLCDDNLIKIPEIQYESEEAAIECENGKVVSYSSRLDIFELLNNFKEKTISDYTFVNKVDFLSENCRENIMNIISACADLVSFDINDYDYDNIFKKILYTHQNFRILTELLPQYGKSSSLYYNTISIVSSDYIDFIAENFLNFTPEKPPVNNLLSRGFCYNNGMYCYIDNQTEYFSTAISDLNAVFELDNNTFFVIFSDIYYENNTETPEYSFAVIREENESFSLLRIGMGEKLPSEDEVRKYALPAASPTVPPANRQAGKTVLYSALALFALSTAAAVILLMLRKRGGK